MMWRICLVFAGLSRLIQADDLVASAEGSSGPPGVVALEQLRAGNLDQALSVLGEVVDQRAAVVEDDPLAVCAAAGGLYRVLAQRSADEKYDVLSAWSLPTESRRSVRILSAPVPQLAPPREFARILGERPRDTSFPISQIGGVRGLFCTGWMLVQAADELGRLRRLTAELEELTDQQVPHADVLLLLARLADSRADAAAIAEQLRQRAGRFAAQPAEQPGVEQPVVASTADVVSTLVLAAAALEHDALQPVARELLETLVRFSGPAVSSPLREVLRVAHATAVQRVHGQSGPETLRHTGLKYWVPSSGRTSSQHAAGAVDAMWLVHEDHILHLAGAGNDVLFFRYPLTGEFEFTCETQVGGEVDTDGGLTYGGLQFEALGFSEGLKVFDSDLVHQQTRLCPLVLRGEQASFNRVGVRGDASGGFQFLSNLHPVWTDGQVAAVSPWLGLRAAGPGRPMFRNFQLTGTPTIPRKVPLLSGSELRGWRSQFLGGTQPPFRSFDDRPTADAQADDFDWTLHEGVLSARQAANAGDSRRQSLLVYQRPLLEQETVAYEFYYEPGAYLVHPALGRLALLMEPGGVRIHWITDGDREWSGLTTDNAAVEPLNRRGPPELPLKADSWNAVSLRRADGALQLMLNEELIYERPIDFGGDLTFGLYRDRSVDAVRVRAIVLSGDWPTELPADVMEQPARLHIDAERAGDARALNRILGADFVAQNVRSVRRTAAMLPPDERFEFLSRWVLPGPSHDDFRLAGEILPLDPSPLAIQLDEPLGHRFSNRAGTDPRNWLVAPVLDLLDVATESGRLAELLSDVENHPVPAEPLQQNARLALLSLIHLARHDAQEAESAVRQLYAQVSGAQPTGMDEMWPETLVAYRGVRSDVAVEAVDDLLLTLYEQRVHKLVPPGLEFWHTQLGSLSAGTRDARGARTLESAGTPLKDALENWIPVIRERYATRGNGNARARWMVNDNHEVVHWSGHQEDYLVYRSPLRGDFAIEASVSLDATRLLAAGSFCGPFYSRNELDIGGFRIGGDYREPVNPPFDKFDHWGQLRAVFWDGTCTLFVNGRAVREIAITSDSDPWVGFRSWWRSEAEVRDVRITGNPVVPDAVPMSSSPDLGMWLPYYSETCGFDGARWQLVNDPAGPSEIVARRHHQYDGMYLESLLRYFRPLVEDGVIEYEFFYEPGLTIVHPALDRLVFLLDEDGVREHWLTDGPADRTEVRPDNAVVIRENQRGRVLLHADRWNDLRLEIAGEMVILTLNNETIYERRLEPENHRTFGLFRYADREVRARNVVMRGQWPRTVPPPSEQELGDDLIDELEARVPELPSVFEHDFARQGLPVEYFQTTQSNELGQIVPRSDGIFVQRAVTGQWVSGELILPFSLEGDFDIEAEFTQLQSSTDDYVCVMLDAHLNDERQHQCRALLKRYSETGQRLESSLSLLHPDGQRSYGSSAHASCSAPGGTLRLCRRGDVVHYLFAENDSRMFRLIGSEEVTAEPTIPTGTRLRTMGNGHGTIQVVWTRISLQAERITYLPAGATESPRMLHVQATDGGGSRILTDVPAGLTHMGSPEWSADGRQIAFDASAGSTTTSRLFVINADGTNLRDIGAGCMPSFSPDGRQIVFSHSGEGILMMNVDGSQRRSIAPDGWGVQWSPDGQFIAYGSSGNIILRDLASGETHELLRGDAASRYSYIYWNLGWSHDSRSIAFKARHRETGAYEVAVVDVAPTGSLTVVYDGERTPNADFSWTADNQQVMFAMHDPAAKGTRLFTVNRTGTDPPVPVPGLPEGHKILDCDVSPDGTRIAYSGTHPPEPIEWIGRRATKE